MKKQFKERRKKVNKLKRKRINDLRLPLLLTENRIKMIGTLLKKNKGTVSMYDIASSITGCFAK